MILPTYLDEMITWMNLIEKMSIYTPQVLCGQNHDLNGIPK
jgi:hypothetical protein